MTWRTKNQKSRKNPSKRVGRNPAETRVERVPRIGPFGKDVYGFPDRITTELRYHMTTPLNSTTGSVAKQGFRWNSCFDPDYTGSGHQPLYWDQYTAMYDNYVVSDARAVVKFANASNAPFIVGVSTDDDTTTSSTIDTLCEQNHSMSTLLPPQTGSLSAIEFHPNWNYETVIGDNPFASQGAKTAIGADPAQISLLNCFAATADASSSSCYVDVYLYQKVTFTELKTPTQS
jgi:hypothetical protein